MSERVYYDPEAETMSRDQLVALQLERLRWQLERCYNASAFYREKFVIAGVGPGDIRSLEDFEHVPFVTKQELREEQARHPPLGRGVIAAPETWRELHPSTGTTGSPVNTIWSERDVELITEITARTLWCFGTRPSDVVQNAFSYGLWVAGLAVHYAAQRIGCLVIPIGAAQTDRQIDYFQNPGATVLLATPSYALYIAERLHERGIAPGEIPLRIGGFGGEPGAEVEATRQKIEEGLGINAFDYYGLAEIGPTFASECPAKMGLHWSEDHYLIEIIDPATRRRCEPGETGVVVITHLTREATPMIRYWTNDVARLDPQPCLCGRTLARLPGGIIGRADDLIIYRGAKFYPTQVEKVVRQFAELSNEFKIVLTCDEASGAPRCTIMVERQSQSDQTEGLRARLREALKGELMVTPEVELLSWGTLERTAFKAKRIDDRR